MLGRVPRTRNEITGKELGDLFGIIAASGFELEPRDVLHAQTFLGKWGLRALKKEGRITYRIGHQSFTAEEIEGHISVSARYSNMPNCDARHEQAQKILDHYLKSTYGSSLGRVFSHT